MHCFVLPLPPPVFHRKIRPVTFFLLACVPRIILPDGLDCSRAVPTSSRFSPLPISLIRPGSATATDLHEILRPAGPCLLPRGRGSVCSDSAVRLRNASPPVFHQHHIGRVLRSPGVNPG